MYLQKEITLTRNTSIPTFLGFSVSPGLDCGRISIIFKITTNGNKRSKFFI